MYRELFRHELMYSQKFSVLISFPLFFSSFSFKINSFLLYRSQAELNVTKIKRRIAELKLKF